MAGLIPTLHDLQQICCDGEAFYCDAAAKIQNAELRRAVQEVGRVRGDLCRDVACYLREKGETPSGGTLYGTLHKLYAELRARFAEDGDRVYVSELEEAEDRLLHAMEEAMLTLEPAEARTVVRRYMPAARAAHERMRALKRELSSTV
jgi:uncharacterized protein (TIGR02284 family)